MFVAVGNLLGQLPEYVRRTRHPERGLMAISDSWHAIGPALVLIMAGGGEPDLSQWPVYLLALAAQFAFDFASCALRESYELGVRPFQQLADMRWIVVVDGLLSPIGFVGVTSDPDHHYLPPPLALRSCGTAARSAARTPPSAPQRSPARR